LSLYTRTVVIIAAIFILATVLMFLLTRVILMPTSTDSGFGQVELTTFLLVYLVMAALSSAAGMYALRCFVLRRISVMNEIAENLRTIGDTRTRRKLRVPLEYDDELTALARSMNSMLDTMDSAAEAMQMMNTRLESRVEERTWKLLEANQELAAEVSEHRQTQVKLTQARDQAIEALNLRNWILSNVSHDARTPLNVIGLRAEMMKKGKGGPLTSKQFEMLDSILINTQQLMVFFNNLLHEAKTQASTIKLRNAPFSPAAVLEAVRNISGPLAERKGLKLTIELDPDMPTTVEGDSERLTQVLTNLVDNAVKFTDHGSIHLRAYVRGDSWYLQVADTGVGIPQDALPHIFQAFWQVDGSATRDANRGVGLGLSIVKQLVTLMGGEVHVDSQPGRGTIFKIILPTKAPITEDQAAHATH
jgi:signal transduction histidine kinase